MIEVKTFSGGLDLDSSIYHIEPNDYTDAVNITHDAVGGGKDRDITSIVANRIGDETYIYPSGTNKCIGAHPNTLRNTVIQFNFNSEGKHHVLEFNLTTRIITKIFENLTDSGDIDILGFTQEGKILSINILNRDEGDLLFFLDSEGRPTQMDIDLFKSGEYTPVPRSVIDVAMDAPLVPPSVIYGNDTSIRSNGYRNKLLRFRYRWIRDNFMKSALSSISKVPLPVSILDDTYTNIVTNNNVISMVVNTGGKDIKAIEIAMSFVEKTNDWSDFLSIQVIKKADLGLVQNTSTSGGFALYDQVYTTFSGVVIPGTVVNIYVTQLPSTKTLVATYTVVLNDTLSDIVDGLIVSMVTIGIITSYSDQDNSLLYLIYNPTYTFDEVEIIDTNAIVDNIDIPFQFYNDSTYPNIDIEESVQLFDYVPDKANAQEMPNGNILAYIGITEGYDKDTVPNNVITVGVVAVDVVPSASFSATQTLGLDNPNIQESAFSFSGIPVAGTVIEIKVKRESDGAIINATSYTTVVGDTSYTVGQHLDDNVTTPNTDILVSGSGILFVVAKNVYDPISGNYYAQMIITQPAISASTNSIPTWKWSTASSIARGYFDKKGKTNGILYKDKVTFPAYAENGSQQPLVPYINYKVYDIPPIWAYSMQFYMTKEGTQYIFWQGLTVNKDEAQYIYIDVTSFIVNASKKPTTATVLSYAFKDGDRMRFIRDTDSPGAVFDYTYDSAITGLVVDPKINSTPKTGSFLKIPNIEPFTSGIDSAKSYVIEIYRPTQQTANVNNQVYYEFGQQYNIIDAGLVTRRHSGMVTDQVQGVTPAEYNFYEGDAYFRNREIAVSDAGYAIFNVMDRNFVDIYTSAVNSIDGRPSIIDENARRAYYSTLIRHGLAYQANTNENGLNRFYSKNFDEYDYSFGDALAMRVKNRQLIIFQKYKIGNVPLFSSIGKDTNGLTVVFNTDKLLNPIQYYAGDFGIGTCPESIASFNYAIYGCDNIKGVIWRLSNDGIQPLSILYKVNTWANENLSQKYTDYKAYGAFDQRLNNYIISLSTNDTSCIGVSVPIFALPDGEVDGFYTFSTNIFGTPNFTLSNFVKPDWMSIVVSGNTITFSGTPNVAADDIPVSFDIENACGFESVETVTFNIVEMVTGTIDMWGGLPTAVPAGWLLCDGSAVSRLTYAALFAATGTLYGSGDGSTTFNLPNIKQRVPVGYDASVTDYNTVGKIGGSGTATLTDQQIAHKHTYDKYESVGGTVDGDNGPTDFSYVSTDTSSIGNPAISRDAVDTRDKFITFPFKIKT